MKCVPGPASPPALAVRLGPAPASCDHLRYAIQSHPEKHALGHKTTHAEFTFSSASQVDASRVDRTERISKRLRALHVFLCPVKHRPVTSISAGSSKRGEQHPTPTATSSTRHIESDWGTLHRDITPTITYRSTGSSLPSQHRLKFAPPSHHKVPPVSDSTIELLLYDRPWTPKTSSFNPASQKHQSLGFWASATWRGESTVRIFEKI